MNGDAELLLPRFLSLFEEHRGDRRQLLRALSEVEGIEVTGGALCAVGLADTDNAVPELVRQACPRPTVPPCSTIITPNTEFADMCLVEIARGCPYRCTFCYVGHNLNPYHTQSFDDIMSWVDANRERTNKFGFISSAVASHPRIDDLCLRCDEANLKVSFASVRAEDVTPVMIRTLARSGTNTLTIAPEAGSLRLRRLLGKARLTDERIFEVIDQAVRAGIPNVKLYFMIGLPTETEDDLLGIPRLVERVQHVFVAASRPRGHIGTLGLNLGIFVPKPRTPLERFDLMQEKQVRTHSAILQKHLNRIDNLKVQMPSVPMALVQTVLSRGDARTARFLEAAHAAGGDWKPALKELTRRGEEWGIDA